MLTTKRKPSMVGEILVEAFMQPNGADASRVGRGDGRSAQTRQRAVYNNLRSVTASTALILAHMFGNSPDFCLNVQRRGGPWDAMNSPRERKRIERAEPLGAAA